MDTRHEVTEENAPKFLEWIAKRGGVAIWPSVDLSDPSASMSSPALTTEGEPTPKPHWKLALEPSRVITDASLIDVMTWKEVKRFHVGVRRGDGLSFTLTDGATRKLRAAVAKAGENATYRFDYETQEAVIVVPDKVVPLDKWVDEAGVPR
ncbi:MAG TPA: hypothetical protein VII50_00450 [Acidothermaceae bacterium]